MFLELTEQGVGQKVLIGILHITEIIPSGSGAYIDRHNAMSRRLYVTESYDYIMQKLNAQDLIL
jgi:hypothetical protein